MNSRTTISTAAGLGILAVGLGAFGAHALKAMLIETGRLDVYQTAVAYHFYHVFALLITGVLMITNSNKMLRYAAFSFLTGILLFSGSLYLICLLDVRGIGVLTPVGGVFFMGGWLFVLLASLKKH